MLDFIFVVFATFCTMWEVPIMEFDMGGVIYTLFLLLCQ
jgi:hypothetical protein